MQNTLTKDEKFYIQNQVNRYIGEHKINTIGLEEFVIECVTKDSKYMKMVKAVEECLGKINLHCSSIRVWNEDPENRFVICGGVEKYGTALSFEYTLSDAKFKEYAKNYSKVYKTNDRYNKGVLYEKYFIEFSTWKVLKAERLNKVNELINLIIEKEFK